MPYLLFDFDDVLNHTKFFSHKIVDDNGIDRSVVNDFFCGPYQACLAGKADPRIVLAEHMHAWGWEGSVDALLDFWHEYEDDIDQEMIAFLKALHTQGIRFSIATNQDVYRAKYVQKRLDDEAVLYDQFYTSAMIGAHKPQEEFYQYISRDLKEMYALERSKIFFTDDVKKNVDAAIKHGWHAHHFQRIEGYQKALDQVLTMAA